MKILHISDWHGEFVPVTDQDYDIVVCSGDLMPNWDRANIERNKEGQPRWVESHLPQFKKLIEDRPFLFCAGNHDFIDPCPILQEGGIDAHNITNKRMDLRGKTFYGFPYIWWPVVCTFIAGEWMYELHIPEMQYQAEIMMEQFPIDILVCHSPLAGYLDKCRDDRAGSSVLANALFYGEEMPSIILCGHLHDGAGYLDLGETQISNAATTWRIIDVKGP